jgi:hypothetical protein
VASALTALRIAALAALAACTCAAPANAATPVVRSDPALFPDFRFDTPDYVVRCKAGERVELKVTPPDGTRVSVARGSAHSGHFEKRVSVDPGRGFAIAVRRSGGKRRNYHVRCLPRESNSAT